MAMSGRLQDMSLHYFNVCLCWCYSRAKFHQVKIKLKYRSRENQNNHSIRTSNRLHLWNIRPASTTPPPPPPPIHAGCMIPALTSLYYHLQCVLRPTLRCLHSLFTCILLCLHPWHVAESRPAFSISLSLSA